MHKKSGPEDALTIHNLSGSPFLVSDIVKIKQNATAAHIIEDTSTENDVEEV